MSPSTLKESTSAASDWVGGNSLLPVRHVHWIGPSFILAELKRPMKSWSGLVKETPQTRIKSSKTSSTTLPVQPLGRESLQILEDSANEIIVIKKLYWRHYFDPYPNSMRRFERYSCKVLWKRSISHRETSTDLGRIDCTFLDTIRSFQFQSVELSRLPSGEMDEIFCSLWWGP